MNEQSHQSMPRAAASFRACEMIALFFIGPALIYMELISLRWLMPLLILFGIVVFIWLCLDRSFDRKRLWISRAALRDWRRMAITFLIGAALLAALTIAFVPERLLAFPRHSPGVYTLVMVLYPLLSAYPQEVIYRAFFFHRYGVIFGSPAGMITSSALAFGWAHIIFENWIALVLSTAGGALFAWTYHRTRSTVASTIEHALYGDFLFTIGLGWYFFTGSVGAG